MKWIKCSDKLPELGKLVLVYSECFIIARVWDKNEWDRKYSSLNKPIELVWDIGCCCPGCCQFWEISPEDYWMELPDAPKEK